MSSLPCRSRETGRPYVSPSQISKFYGEWGCELAYQHHYIDKWPSRPKSASLHVGTAFDRALNTGHAAKIETHTNPDPDLLAETFIDTWRSDVDQRDDDPTPVPVEIDRSDAPPKIEDKGANAAREYAQTTLLRVDPLETQRKVSVGFDETDVELVGWVDLVAAADGDGLPGVVVVDHKTSISKKSKSWTHHGAAEDTQLRLYQAALGAEGETVTARGWRGWHFQMTQTKHQEAIVAARPEDDPATFSLLASVIDRMEQACESGLFLPTARMRGSFKCSERLCDFWDRCEHGKRARVAVAITRGEAA